MVIYLWHPVHGTKVATLEQEAVADEKNGWARFNLDESTVAKEPVNNLGKKRPVLSRPDKA